MKLDHGRSRTNDKTYTAWCNMKTRCTNENFVDARYYSEAGISYDPSWKHFNNFIADMGEAPEGYLLDRIDNNKGYNKENCRWATPTESARNRRNVRLTKESVLVIKKRLSEKPVGMSFHRWNKHIAKDYGVGPAAINSIRLGLNWTDVGEPS
jgi:hypothetical protein